MNAIARAICQGAKDRKKNGTTGTIIRIHIQKRSGEIKYGNLDFLRVHIYIYIILVLFAPRFRGPFTMRMH